MRDLTSGSLPRHILAIAVPSAMGFLFSTMYNIVDNLFVGSLPAGALAAVGRAFPVFFLFVITLDVGLATGVSALVANSLGADDRDKARLYTAQGIGLAALLSVAVLGLGWALSPFLLGRLGAEGEELALALVYVYPLLAGGWFLIMGFTMNGALQATGDTVTVFTAAVVGFLLNIGFNWLFLRLGYGLAGIAYGTALIQVLNFFFFAYRLQRAGLFGRRDFARLWPRKGPMLDVLRQSVPATLNMTTVALGIYLITEFASHYGADAVAAYIVATRIEQFVLLPCIGMNAAVLALTGQNYGAGKYERVRRVLPLSMRYGIAFTVIGGILVFVLAPNLMRPFTDQPGIIADGASYLRVTVFVFPAYMALFLAVAYLQGLKRPMFALWLGAYRQIAAPLLLFSLVVYRLESPLVGLWWSIAAINASGALISLLWVRRVERRELVQCSVTGDR